MEALSAIPPAQLTDAQRAQLMELRARSFEEARKKRIAENQAKLASLGLLSDVQEMVQQ